MPRYTVHATATMRARPEIVWDILTDYRTDHPRILPKGFGPLQVERGGTGAGTVIHFSVRTLGITREFHGEVSTPEPGRVLVESYTDGSVTTFTVTPEESDQSSQVQISTEMDTRSGLSGVIERALTRPAMSRLFRAELGKLAVLAESRVTVNQHAG